MGDTYVHGKASLHIYVTDGGYHIYVTNGAICKDEHWQTNEHLKLLIFGSLSHKKLKI